MPGHAMEAGAVADHRDLPLRPPAEPVPEPGYPPHQDLVRLEHDRLRVRAVAMPPRVVEVLELEMPKLRSELGGGAPDGAAALQPHAMQRPVHSEELRVGEECFDTSRPRW